MRKIALVLLLALAGCTGQNTGPNTLQFNSETIPFPDDYMAAAAEVVSMSRVAEGATVLVSRPQPTIGVSPTSPRRWYVCIRGLEPRRAPPDTLPPLVDALFQDRSREEQFDTVLIFAGPRSPSVEQGYNSVLCRDAEYAPIGIEVERAEPAPVQPQQAAAEEDLPDTGLWAGSDDED